MDCICTKTENGQACARMGRASMDMMGSGMEWDLVYCKDWSWMGCDIVLGFRQWT